MTRLTHCTLAVLLLAPTLAFSQTIYVNQAASGADDGTSWLDAYQSLQDGLADAALNPGSEVWVARGIYTPGSLRTDSFILPADVEIFGGFNGTETAATQASPLSNLTILSGNIGLLGGEADNVYTVVDCNQASFLSRLDGFIIRDGFNDRDPSVFPFTLPDGAGIRCVGAEPTIANCVITHNKAPGSSNNGRGGGIFIDGNGFLYQPSIINCIFSFNESSRGGAMTVIGADPTVDLTRFEENSATLRAGAVDVIGNGRFTRCHFRGNSVNATTPNQDGGGAVYCAIASFGEFRACVFDGNIAYNSPGGAVSTYHNSTKLLRSTFVNNESIADAISGDTMPSQPGGRGGAIFVENGCNIVSCRVANNRVRTSNGDVVGRGGGMYLRKAIETLVSCELVGNEATRGGGLYAENNFENDALWAVFTAYNCTFFGNSAIDIAGTSGIGGGADALGVDANGGHDFVNCIFRGNVAESGNVALINLNAVPAQTPAHYCCIEDEVADDSVFIFAGNGNIDSNPMFTDENATPL